MSEEEKQLQEVAAPQRKIVAEVKKPRDHLGRFTKGPSEGRPRETSKSRESVKWSDRLVEIPDICLTDSGEDRVAAPAPIRRKRVSTTVPVETHPDSDEKAGEVLAPKISTARRGRAGSRAAPSGEGRQTDQAPKAKSHVEYLLDAEAVKSDCTAEDLREEGVQRLNYIIKTTATSKGKWEAIRPSARAIYDVIEALASKSQDARDTLRLKADNERLRKEVERCKADMAELRRELAKLKVQYSDVASTTANSAQEASGLAALGKELEQSLTVTLGKMMSARMAVLEERLPPVQRIRPPLRAADKILEPESAKPTQGERAKKPTEPLPTATRADDGWVRVGKRGKTERRGEAHRTAKVVTARVSDARAKPKASAPRSAKVKLRAPQSAAVVFTLQPEALNRGISYADVVQMAQEKIDVQELGIEKSRLRQSATGARMLEIFGPHNAEKADSFAAKLKNILSGVASVVRPVKCANLSVTYLDDATTQASLAAALAAKSECDASLFKVGEIRRRDGGTGTCLVTCPILAAKKLSAMGGLMVGFSEVRVRALRARPMRCYRCMGLGHTRPQCPSTVDRGGLCFRCGDTGHKAATCQTGNPRCAICADTGRPSGHVMGGMSCVPPKVLGVGFRARSADNSAERNQPRQEDVMSG